MDVVHTHKSRSLLFRAWNLLRGKIQASTAPSSAFEGSAQTKRTRSFRVPSTSGSAAAIVSTRTLRERARHLGSPIV